MSAYCPRRSSTQTTIRSTTNSPNDPNGYVHRRIQHSQKIYVMGETHTNTIEGFWSLLRRGIGGVYHSVSAKHLQMYCNEYSYRYNRRFSEEPMFTSLLSDVVAKAE